MHINRRMSSSRRVSPRKLRHLLRLSFKISSSTRIRLLKSSLTLGAIRQENRYQQASITKVCFHFLTVLLDLLLKEEGLEFREEVVYPDGAVYKGQLKVGSDTRHGFGIQVWPDGAKYEGNWRNNVASGRGKFYHIDGDVYDGNSLCDKYL
jgi:hypothetical protein